MFFVFLGAEGPRVSKNNVVSCGQSKKRPWLACARMQTSADKKWKVRLGCVLCNHFRNSEKISISPDGLTSTTAEKSSKQTKKSLLSISWGSFQIPVMLFKRRKTHVQQHAKTRCHQRALMHWIDQAPSASKSSQCESESQVGPPKEQWDKILKGLRTGKSAR